MVGMIERDLTVAQAKAELASNSWDGAIRAQQGRLPKPYGSR
jgi:hypothetical protein